MISKYLDLFKNDHKLIYFDNAATSVRPISFVEAYSTLEKIPHSYDFVSELIFKISNYLCVDKSYISLVFNASVAINLIAQKISLNKTIYLSTSEHISNVVSWQKIYGAKEVVFFDIYEWKHIEFKENSIVSISLTTNLLGKEIDLDEICDFFKSIRDEKKITLILDTSQTMQYKHIDLSNKDVDYLFFTAHKFFGPNGVAVIYSPHHKFGVNLFNQKDWECENLDWKGLYAWNVSFEEISYFFEKNMVEIREKFLLNFFRENFPQNEHIEWINPENNNLIFLLKTKQVHAHDFIFYLEKHNVVVRSGLCCSYSPELKHIENNIFRVSLSFLNTEDELNYFFKLIGEYSVDMSF